MEKEQLLKKLAELESVNDQLQTELEYIDSLMRSVGFTHGLATVKATAQELYERQLNGEEEEETGEEVA